MQLSAITGALGRFFAELQRRKVLRIAAGYFVGAWIILQVALALQTAMKLPEGFSTIVLSVLIIGLPIALIAAWFFEFTPDGIKRTVASGNGAAIKPKTTDLILAGALGLVVVVAIAQALIPREQSVAVAPEPATTDAAQASKPNPEPPALGDKSIAVLPFANLSPDNKNEYFADGLTEELLNLLAKIADLKVISRTSSFAFKGKNTPLPEIAKQLGVRHILEGSVRTAGDQLRVTAQLIDVVTDTHLWTETFERKVENVFVLQDEIARAIASALKIEVTVTTAGVEAPTKSLGAYRLYLQGRELFRVRGDSAIEQGIVLLKQATALDPAFAEAQAVLAASYYARSDSGSISTPAQRIELEALARDSAHAALARKPKLGLPRAILSALHRRDFEWDAATTDGERAVANDPSESMALLQLGLARLSVGNVEGAAEALATARRVDPYYEHVLSWSIICEFSRGNEAAGLALAETLSRSPTGYGRLADLILATSAYDKGDGAAAERHFRAFVANIQRPVLDAIARALRDPKAKAEAVRALEEADAGPVERRPRFLELYLSLLGEHRRLLALALRRVDSKDGERVGLLLTGMWQPRFAPLRQDPQFKVLVRRVGLVDYWKKHGWPDRCRPKGEDDFECS
jgi:TolB-like protein